MNCNCVKEIEARIQKHMQPAAGAGCTVSATTTGLVVNDDGLQAVLQIPFCVKGPLKGYNSATGKTIGCNVNVCPFCARPAGRYAIGEDSGIATAFAGATA